MAQPSSENFLDILIQELKLEIRAEMQAEAMTQFSSQTSAPQKMPKFAMATEASLLLELGPKIFSSPQKSYKLQKPQNLNRPQPKIRPQEKIKMAHHLTAEQYLQFKILQNLGANLPENFTEIELKKEFRKLTHRFHPDHQIEASEACLQSTKEKFRTLKNCYDCLKNSLS